MGDLVCPMVDGRPYTSLQNKMIIEGRGCIMHQSQEIRSIAQELMNVTEGIMATGIGKVNNIYETVK